MNPYKDLEETSFLAAPHLTYEDIATKLLKDHHFLTALELHTELVESGRELPQLREFFSNPGNFEQHVSRTTELGSMHRSPSQATLDSLDAARYSEDGGGDRGGSGGDVAVLEFELRKARETINSLRANLTQFADEDSILDRGTKDHTDERSLKPHEKRALNFLINEYLLLQEYKLTSITFSDENPDQDFEDWDDVGLNVPRPSGLAGMLWGNKSTLKAPMNDVASQVYMQIVESSCQTEVMDDHCANCQLSDNDGDWHHELLVQAEEIRLLKEKVIALETEKLNFQKLYDAAIVSLNSLTSPASETKCLDLNIPDDKLQIIGSDLRGPGNDPRPLTLTASDNHYGSNTHSTHSATPEQFELIENEKNSSVRKEGSNTSWYESAMPGGGSPSRSPLRHGSASTLDETLSINDGGEWTRVHYHHAEPTSKDMWIDSGLPNNLKVNLLNWCCETNEPITNELLSELVNNDKPITLQGLLNLVADTIPRVVPHMLVARRCETVALLAAAAHLAEPARRSRLLHVLLTMKKAPDVDEARLICQAACLVVKWGGSGEVLSCVAELLASRSAERRVLASQVCLAAAPYVSVELCTSLLLSLVALMCDASEPQIRALGLKAACLITPVADHKYGQLENLWFGFLNDLSEEIVRDSANMFAPVLARTALIAGKFSSDLLTSIMSNLVKSSNDKEWKNVLLYLSVIKILVLANLAHVINVQIIKDVTLTNCDSGSINYQEISLESEQDSLLDIQCYMTDSNYDAKVLMSAMNSLIKEKPDVRWPELLWFISLVKQILNVAVSSECLNQASIYEEYITLINSYVDNFGPCITSQILKPIFMEIIIDLEFKMEKLQSVANENMIVVGIYLVTILPALEDSEDFKTFFHKWIVYSSIRNLPVKIFSVPLRWISRHRNDSLQLYLQLLKEFVTCGQDGGVGDGGAEAVRVYVCTLMAELLHAAHVDDACVHQHLLPTVLALMQDQHVSVRASAISAWGGLTRACVSRSLPGEARCWEAIRVILASGPGSRETARTAEALALLVLPAPTDLRVCDTAVSLICELCVRAPLTSESLSALTPGLQLVSHHARAHPALLPALRKLEEGVQSPLLSQYRPAIEALLQGCAGASPLPTSAPRDLPRAPNLHSAQEVGRRVTQMFAQSKTNMNLQSIFKKKT